MSDGIEQPEIEIVVKHYRHEVALIAYFPDGAGGYTCVVGMEDPGQVDVLSLALQQTALSLPAVVKDGIALSPDWDVPGVEDGASDHPF